MKIMRLHQTVFSERPPTATAAKSLDNLEKTYEEDYKQKLDMLVKEDACKQFEDALTRKANAFLYALTSDSKDPIALSDALTAISKLGSQTLDRKMRIFPGEDPLSIKDRAKQLNHPAINEAITKNKNPQTRVDANDLHPDDAMKKAETIYNNDQDVFFHEFFRLAGLHKRTPEEIKHTPESLAQLGLLLKCVDTQLIDDAWSKGESIDRCTTLIAAIRSKNSVAVEVLLSTGINPNKEVKVGRMDLPAYQRHPYYELAKLVKNGMDKTVAGEIYAILDRYRAEFPELPEDFLTDAEAKRNHDEAKAEIETLRRFAPAAAMSKAAPSSTHVTSSSVSSPAFFSPKSAEKKLLTPQETRIKLRTIPDRITEHQEKFERKSQHSSEDLTSLQEKFVEIKNDIAEIKFAISAHPSLSKATYVSQLPTFESDLDRLLTQVQDQQSKLHPR